MKSLYELTHVDFAYEAGFRLSDINVDIQSSKITAVVGPNGSGKTTLLNILAFLDLPASGTFKYDNIIVNKTNLAELKRNVGYVQQNPYLLRGTVTKNIELGLKLQHVDKIKRDRIVNEVVGILNINHLMERSARSLSGGESQKVAIGQALALEPKVLILDEPFTYLDEQAINELEQLITRLKEKHEKTIILTTHNKLQAQCLADQVYSVIKGKTLESELLNMFFGRLDVDTHYFNTGKQSILVPESITSADHIAIDPRQIVLSRHKLDSSMQNSFQGRITSVSEQDEQLKLLISAGEEFYAVITHKAMDELELSIGSDVWISFKSSSILVL